MPDIKITPLGAGQDVGRSCLLLSMGGKNIMLDCGMHMGYNDERRFPDFSYIVPEGPITSHIDCVIISHFHLGKSMVIPGGAAYLVNRRRVLIGSLSIPCIQITAAPCPTCRRLLATPGPST